MAQILRFAQDDKIRLSIVHFVFFVRGNASG